jgi:hypothetical protein
MIFVGFLIVATFALATELITRDGVGVVEYVVGIAVVAALVYVAARITLKDRRPSGV